MRTIAESCYLAAKLVRVGWFQGAYAYFPDPAKRKPTCYCMAGAINRVCDGAYFDSGPLSGRVKNFVSSKLLGRQPVEHFNDLEGMTKKDAVACLIMAGDIATFEGV